MARLINIKFKATTRGATQAIMPKIANDFNRIFRRNKKNFEQFAQNTVILKIREHPAYASLLSDDLDGLRAELGLEDPIGQIQPILEHWEKSIKVEIDTVKVAGTRLAGGIRLIGINDTFRDVVNLPTASFYAERARTQNITPFLIEWLDWLLLKGDQPLVFGFYVDTNLRPTDNSRTGLAVMRDQRIARLSGVEWTVPAEFQGVREANWITDAVFDSLTEIREYILLSILPQIGDLQRIRL